MYRGSAFQVTPIINFDYMVGDSISLQQMYKDSCQANNCSKIWYQNKDAEQNLTLGESILNLAVISILIELLIFIMTFHCILRKRPFRKVLYSVHTVLCNVFYASIFKGSKDLTSEARNIQCSLQKYTQAFCYMKLGQSISAVCCNK